MERRDRAGLAIFMAQAPLVAGNSCTLGPDEARHIRVRRLDVGAEIGLRDGEGTVAEGVLVRATRQGAVVEVTRAEQVAPPRAVHVLVPVADRDRLLWLAEKAAELACTSWRPVLWRRSRSVAPRGEGVTFQGKVRARMAGALTQSRGAWLPQLFPEATIDRAVHAAPEGARLVLDPDGVPLVGPGLPIGAGPVTIAVGPEGGFEPDELAALHDAGFVSVSLGASVLRFETAAVVALGAVRASDPTRPLEPGYASR